jgi:hypothetical protein
MGTLYYGDARTPIQIDDRALAHLKIVIIAKLRRSEGFGFSWPKGLDLGGGRFTAWFHPGVTLLFEFSGGREASINREWLELLSQSASTPLGLTLMPEPPNTHSEPVDPATGRLRED